MAQNYPPPNITPHAWRGRTQDDAIMDGLGANFIATFSVGDVLRTRDFQTKIDEDRIPGDVLGGGGEVLSGA